jgi:hypothetical protein
MQKKLLNCGYISLDCGKDNFTKNNSMTVNFDKGDIIHLKRVKNKEIYIYPNKPYMKFHHIPFYKRDYNVSDEILDKLNQALNSLNIKKESWIVSNNDNGEYGMELYKLYDFIGNI